eukprot:g76667.t1
MGREARPVFRQPVAFRQCSLRSGPAAGTTLTAPTLWCCARPGRTTTVSSSIQAERVLTMVRPGWAARPDRSSARGLASLAWWELGEHVLARHAPYLCGRAGWPALGLTRHVSAAGGPSLGPDPVVVRAWLALERAVQRVAPCAGPGLSAPADPGAVGAEVRRWAAASFRQRLAAETERCLRDAASLGDEASLWGEYQRLGALPRDLWQEWVAPVVRHAWGTGGGHGTALHALCLELNGRRWWAGVRDFFAAFAPPPDDAADSPFAGQGWPAPGGSPAGPPGVAELAAGQTPGGSPAGPPAPGAWRLAWPGLQAACGSAAGVAEALRWLQDAEDRQDTLSVPRWDGAQRDRGCAEAGLPPLVELLGGLLQHALPELRDLADPGVADSDSLFTLSPGRLEQRRRADLARARAARLRRVCAAYRQLEAGAALLCPGSEAHALLRALAGSTLAASFRAEASAAGGADDGPPGSGWPGPLLQARHALWFNFLLLSLLWGAGEVWAHGAAAEARVAGTLAAAWARVVSRFQSLCAARVRLLGALPEVRAWQAECEAAYGSLSAAARGLDSTLATATDTTPPAAPGGALLPGPEAAGWPDTSAWQWLAHGAVLGPRVDAYLSDVASEWQELLGFVRSRWGWELPALGAPPAAGGPGLAPAGGPGLGTLAQLHARLAASHRQAQFLEELRRLLVHWPAAGA